MNARRHRGGGDDLSEHLPGVLRGNREPGYQESRQAWFIKDERDICGGKAGGQRGHVIVNPIGETGHHTIEKALAGMTRRKKTESQRHGPGCLGLHCRDIIAEHGQQGLGSPKRFSPRPNRLAVAETNAAVDRPASA